MELRPYYQVLGTKLQVERSLQSMGGQGSRGKALGSGGVEGAESWGGGNVTNHSVSQCLSFSARD